MKQAGMTVLNSWLDAVSNYAASSSAPPRLAAMLNAALGKDSQPLRQEEARFDGLRSPAQTPPQGGWLIWLFLGGRGAGKTRAGAEWVREQARDPDARIALVAPTFNDVREVMIEGVSGLRRIGLPDECPRYEASRHRLVWPNGAIAYGFSAEDPDGLRGPQFSAAWGDDARPWPDFPARDHVWSDGANWRSGHWLNGRAGQVLLADIVTELAGEAGQTDVDVTGLPHILSGYLVTGGQSARSALEPLVELFDIRVVESASTVRISAADGALPAGNEPAGGLIADPVAVSRRAAADRPGDLRLSFFDDTANYNPGEVRARQSGDADRGAMLAVPVLADPGLAEDWVAAKLERQTGRDAGWSVFLPPSMLACEPGDVITLDGKALRLTAGRGDAAREMECETVMAGSGVLAGSQSGASLEAGLPPARALVRVLDIPSLPEDGADRGGPFVLAFADPWHGPRTIVTRAGPGPWSVRQTMHGPGGLGELTHDLPARPPGRWDLSSICELRLVDGALASRSAIEVLNGANRIAIAGPDGEWEILQFRDAELAGPQTYRLSGLLRGQSGSRVLAHPAGSDVALLDGRPAVLALAEHEASLPLDIQALARDEALPTGGGPQAGFIAHQRHLRPLSPVHPRLVRRDGHWRLDWIRRSRVGGDGWAGLDIPLGEDRELYRVRLWRSGEDELLLETRTSTTWLDLDAAQLSGPDTGLPGAIDVEIAQLSDRVGAGEPLCARLVL